jgi:uncharacterized protein YjbI with pentapeptide repeats
VSVLRIRRRRRPDTGAARVLGAEYARARHEQEDRLRRDLVARHRTNQLRVVAVIAVLTIGPAALIWLGYQQDWTGFAGNTLWDWLDLVIVPATLAVAAYLLSRTTSRRERELAGEREFYVLLASQLSQTDSIIALRLYALNTLRLVDARGKGQVVLALYEAGLISGSDPKISLQHADLRQADLSRLKLPGVNLSGADLRAANLAGTDLTRAFLRETILVEAGDLTPVPTPESRTTLSEASFEGTDLTDARLGNADLSRARLAWPTLLRTDLRGADLSRATTFEVVEFQGVDLREAKLGGADLQVATFDERVQWEKSRYNSKTIWKGDFRPPPGESFNTDDLWRARASLLRNESHLQDKGDRPTNGAPQ